MFHLSGLFLWKDYFPESALKKRVVRTFLGCFVQFGVYVCVCVFLDLSPSSHLIADKELETENKQNEAELERGRVYYEKIKDSTRLSLPIVFVFFCLAEVVSVFPFSLFVWTSLCQSIFLSSVILHQIAFGGSTWNFPGIASIMSRMPPQKTINVYGFV